jgi:hypothetical protein
LKFETPDPLPSPAASVGCPSTKLLVDQLREFPIAKHDDGPDALEMAVRLAAEMLAGVRDDGLGNRLRVES